jgi:hypothetical protein
VATVRLADRVEMIGQPLAARRYGRARVGSLPNTNKPLPSTDKTRRANIHRPEPVGEIRDVMCGGQPSGA